MEVGGENNVKKECTKKWNIKKTEDNQEISKILKIL